MNLFLTVDNTSNVIQTASYTSPSSVPTGDTVVIVDDSVTNAQATLQRPSDYTYVNGAIVRRPWFSLAYGSGKVTATLNDAPATPPTSVTFTVCGQTITANVTSTTTGTPAVTTYSAQLALNVHASVTTQTINVGVSASGCVDGSINIGGQQNDIALQAYTPTGGTLTVAPTGTGSKSFLSTYWTSTAVNEAYSSADIGTAIGMMFQTLYGVILPALTSGTTPIVTLTANQKNAVTDVTNNVLPSVATTLENAAPVPAAGASQTYDLHYAHYVKVQKATKTAMDNYVNDLSTIPNLA